MGRLESKLAHLAAYERMHADIARQYREVSAQVEARKAAGTMKGASGNQLLAQKVSLKTTLSMYEHYGLSVPLDDQLAQ